MSVRCATMLKKLRKHKPSKWYPRGRLTKATLYKASHHPKQKHLFTKTQEKLKPKKWLKAAALPHQSVDQ
jgi:hypothetical protein